MNQQRILLAIEAMSEVERMATVAAEYGYALVVLAEDPSLYGRTSAAQVVQFPTRDHNAIRDYIERHRQEIAQVFSVTDTWGIVAAELRDEFAFPQFAPADTLRRLRDKKYVQERLEQCGLISSRQGWPRIIKPRGGTGKIGVILVHSQEEFDDLIAQGTFSPQECLQQPFHFGPLYSAEIWRDSSQFYFFGLTNRILSGRPYFTETVKSFPWAANSEWEKQVEHWARTITEALDYTFGQAHIEFIGTAHGYELVEINCRMAGALITPGVLATTNYAPYRMAVEHALGVPISLPPQRTVTGGFSHVSVYAEKPGILRAIHGLEKLRAYPGNPQWHASKDLGDTISDIGTYRSRIGNISARGENAGLAQDRAIAAATEVSVTID